MLLSTTDFQLQNENDAQTRSFHNMLLSHVCTAADFVGPSCCNRDIELIMKQTEVYPSTTCYQFLTDRLYSRTKHCFVHIAIRSQLAWERYYPSASLKNSLAFTSSTFLSLVQHSFALDINSYTVLNFSQLLIFALMKAQTSTLSINSAFYSTSALHV